MGLDYQIIKYMKGLGEEETIWFVSDLGMNVQALSEEIREMYYFDICS